MIIRSAVLVLAVIVFAACGSVPEPTPSASGSPEATTSAAPVSGGMPPGCEPIDLRDSSGQTLDLTGEWAGSGRIAADTEIARLLQMGDCLHGSVSGEVTFASLPGVETTYEVITNLVGRIRSDFTIDVELLVVSQPTALPVAEYSAVVMVIEWDEATGQIRLREDREPGTMAQRCDTEFCSVPVLWYRVDEPSS